MISSKLSVGQSAGRRYSVEEHEHGVIIRGEGLPVTDFCALAESASKRGFDLLDAGIGSALGHAITVFTNREQGDLWRREIEARNVERFPDDPERQWLFGCDTGTSSLTIFSALSRYGNAAFIPNRHLSPDIPHDPDDFGRCYRLIHRMSGWRDRLSEVAAKYPAWAPFAREWSNLEALWLEEESTGKCPKLYDAMQVLRKE